MKMIIDSGSSSILLNRVPGKVFHYKRGVRQGDPFPPLLFVLAADLLQSIIISSLHQGVFSLPLPLRCGIDFSIVQYVDDTLLFSRNMLSTTSSSRYKKYNLLWHFVFVINRCFLITKDLLWHSGDKNNIIEGVLLNTFFDVLIKKHHKW
jgi:hypothetical protein